MRPPELHAGDAAVVRLKPLSTLCVEAFEAPAGRSIGRAGGRTWEKQRKIHPVLVEMVGGLESEYDLLLFSFHGRP